MARSWKKGMFSYWCGMIHKKGALKDAGSKVTTINVIIPVLFVKFQICTSNILAFNKVILAII
jgi:hypothetical protein